MIYSLVTELTNVFKSDQEKQVTTSISLIPIDQVPFPTIVLSAGGPINPLGFVTHSHNLVTEADLQERGKMNGRTFCHTCIFKMF